MKDFPYDKLKKVVKDIEQKNGEISEIYYSLADLSLNGDFNKIFILKLWLDYLEWAIIGIDEITRFLGECSECRYHSRITENEMKKIFLRYKETMQRLRDDDQEKTADIFSMAQLS